MYTYSVQFFDGDQDGIVNAKDFAKLPIQHIMTEEHDDYDSTMHMDFGEYFQLSSLAVNGISSFTVFTK